MLILIPFYNSTFTKWYNNIEEFIAHVYQKVKNTIGSIYNLIPHFRHPDNRVINRICELIPHLEFPNRDEQVFEFKYKNESLDNKGRLIRNIYFYNRDFIIYQTIDSVEWMINSQQDETLINPLEYSQRINKIIFSLADLESLNPKKIGRPQTINKLIAQGIKLALQDDISNSQQVLEKAKERLKALRITYYKQHYLIASFYAASLIIFTMISINYMHKFFGEHLINILQNLQISAELTTVVICGCLGGLLSVSYGIKEIVINPDDDFVVGGISRIFIAVISSIIIYITVKADIVPDLSRLLLNDSSRPDLWRVGFVSVLAGFIESLVPNLLKKQAPKEDKQNNNTT